MKFATPKILNSDGKPVLLTLEEKEHCAWAQRMLNERHPSMVRKANALGFEISITTLTAIAKKISVQKFFEIPPADYLPVRVGEGTWSSNITTYRSFDIADEFETGVINTGGQHSRLASADAGVDSLNIKVFPWAKSIDWSIFDLEFAAKSGNWDLVSAKEKARKRNWDLGIQRVAFLGARGQNGSSGTCLGLLNQPGVTNNTAVIPKAIHTMTPDELNTFSGAIIEAYRNNCNRTAWPTHFIIPESDYNGLANQASATYPLRTKLSILEEVFGLITRNKGFKILPLAYGDAQYHADCPSIAGLQVYVLENYDEESVRMDIPLDYTNTLANSVNNFSFENVGYGQFTGVLAYRPLEMMYFTYAA